MNLLRSSGQPAPQWNPVTQRDESLALRAQTPSPDSEDRTPGGVLTVRSETPPLDRGEGRRDSGRDPGTLRRTQATTMLHLSSCSPDEARRSLNWRPLSPLTEVGRDAREPGRRLPQEETEERTSAARDTVRRVRPQGSPPKEEQEEEMDQSFVLISWHCTAFSFFQ